MTDMDTEFNNCTCDLWPNGEPHRHIGALQDVASPPILGVNFVKPWSIVTDNLS